MQTRFNDEFSLEFILLICNKNNIILAGIIDLFYSYKLLI